MCCVADLIDLWPSKVELAKDLGVLRNHVYIMRKRGTIPFRYWPRLIMSAHRRSLTALNYHVLIAMHVPAAMFRPPGEPD